MTTRPDVNPMRAEDLPSVCELASQLGYPAALDRLQARFARILDRPEQALFVARRDGRVAGWLHAQAQHPLESEPFAEITGLVVDQTARRSGVGRALVERTCDWARQLGYGRVRVRSNVQRSESHRFYPALGFQLAKTQHNYSLDLSE